MRYRPALLDKWKRSQHLKRHLKHHFPVGRNRPRLRVSVEEGTWHQARFVRDVGRLHVILGDRQALDGERRVYYFHALPAITYMMSRVAPVVQVKAGLGDGSTDSSDQIAFSANHSTALLVPDPDFYFHHGYQIQRDDPAPQRPWLDRDADIVWRGSTTGWDRGTREPLDLDDPGANQRARICALLNGAEGTDVKIYSVVAPLHPPTDRGILETAGLLGGEVPAASWRDRKFALDIDGNANTFSNLFVRLLFGCCVIKVASPRGYKQWYYERLMPWSHYVPVAADLSDLHERIDWCRTHIGECQEIATAGQALARSMTFDREMQNAVERLNARLG